MKILLTALVIAGAVLVIRRRQRQAELMVVSQRSTSNSGKRISAIHLAVFVVLTIMIAGSAFYFLNQWWDANRIVIVKVIDTTTGRSVEFEAYNGDIEGRSFRTTDGRMITLAAVERLEVAGK